MLGFGLEKELCNFWVLKTGEDSPIRKLIKISFTTSAANPHLLQSMLADPR